MYLKAENHKAGNSFNHSRGRKKDLLELDVELFEEHKSITCRSNFKVQHLK